MKKQIFCTLIALLACSTAFCVDPLKDRLPIDDRRYVTFRYALGLMQYRHVKTIVETGTARDGDENCGGDGGSTKTWCIWAKSADAKVYSVDINPDAIANAKQACKPYRKWITFTCMDSVAYLSQFQQPIDFLYLDSFDFNSARPELSQQHHLKEIIAAYPRLHSQSIVMIDDCDLPYGGKGKLAIDFLLERGWRIALSDYQVILVNQ